MKRKLFNNLGYKLLAIVLAVVLWIVVVNISDSAVTVQIEDIPVEQLNGEIFDDLDKIYEVSSGDTVDIIVKGRRSVVSELDADDFIATADLSTMSVTGAVQIFVKPKSAVVEKDITLTVVDNTMTLILESKASTQFPIKIKTMGATRDGYAVANTYASPNIVTVEGPESSVAKVTDVEVLVDVANKSDTFVQTATVYLYDAYGEKIENSKLAVSVETVDVTVNVYPTKEVPVTVTTVGKPADGYTVSEIIYQPQTVEIVGMQEDLDKVEEIIAKSISVAGLSEDVQTTINLTEDLPDGITIPQSGAEVVVTITIEKLEEKVFKPLISDIELTNKNDNYKYLVSLSDDFSVKIAGLSSGLEELSLSDLGLSVDCSELKLGDNQEVTLTYEDIEGIEYTITGTVSVSISGK